MAIVTGQDGVVKVDAYSATHAATTSVASIRSFTLDMTGEAIDASVMGSSNKDYLAGQTDGTVTVECYWDDADAGQLLFDAGDKLDLEISPQGTGSGKKHYDVAGICTAVSISASFDGIVEASFSLQITGAIAENAHN